MGLLLGFVVKGVAAVAGGAVGGGYVGGGAGEVEGGVDFGSVFEGCR